MLKRLKFKKKSLHFDRDCISAFNFHKESTPQKLYTEQKKLFSETSSKQSVLYPLYKS